MNSQLRLGWVVVLVAAASLLAFAAFDDGDEPTREERVQQLSESYACPVCDGQSVAESNAAVAATIRLYIGERVAEDATDIEIRDELIQAYGGEVLLTPPAEGFSVLIWILPVVVLVAGVAGLFIVFRRRGASRTATEEDAALVAAALDPEPAGNGPESPPVHRR